MRAAPPVVVLAATLVVVACSSSSSSGPATTSTPDAATPDVGAPKPSDDAGSAPDSAPDGATGDAASSPTCGDKAKQVDCVSCCSTLHEAGAITYIAAIAQCMCVPANCQTECESTLCNTDPKEPDGTCGQCLKTKDANCTDALTKACSEDPDCIAFNTCIRGAGCNTKP